MERGRKSKVLPALGPPRAMLHPWGCDPSQTTESEALLKSCSGHSPLSDITTMMVACMGRGEVLKSRPLVL